MSKIFSTFFDNFRAAPVFRPLLGGSNLSNEMTVWTQSCFGASCTGAIRAVLWLKCFRFLRESARQTKPKKGAKRKVHEFGPFLWILVFFLGKTSTIHISNFCSGMPLRKVHELAFPWFGLPGWLLKYFQHFSTSFAQGKNPQKSSKSVKHIPWKCKSCFSNRAFVKAIFEAPKCLWKYCFWGLKICFD